MARRRRCPVCRKPLTEVEYERALGIVGKQQQHLHEAQAKLRDAKLEAKRGKREGVAVERSRTRRLLKGKDKVIQSLKERLSQVRRGTTPQTEGLEFEDKLAKRLREEFEDDKIEHYGHDGDVLQIVRFGREKVGSIIIRM